MSEESTKKSVQGSAGQQPEPKKHKKGIIALVIVAVIAAAGIGFYQWHETPGFCAAFCHNMDEYLETYNEEQGVAGTDKYGNAVSNTNAMMATLHRTTNTTAKPEIRCMGCHQPVIAEQVSEGMSMVTGNYLDPLNERVNDDLTHWWGEDVKGEQLCVNENCHVYLRGADGLVDRDKLEATTVDMEFNPHAQHHEGVSMGCTSCHKGHRASVVACTGCHQHENVSLPEGWITMAESQQLMERTFPGYKAASA